MSIVTDFIQLELRKQDLCARIVAEGEVTDDDRAELQNIVEGFVQNARYMFEDNLRYGRIREFDAFAIANNPALRFELCLRYAKVRGLEEYGVKPESVAVDIDLETAVLETESNSPALMELGRNAYFLEELSSGMLPLAKQLILYASLRGDETNAVDPYEGVDEYFLAFARKNSAGVHQYLRDAFRGEKAAAPQHNI